MLLELKLKTTANNSAEGSIVFNNKCNFSILEASSLGTSVHFKQ